MKKLSLLTIGFFGILLTACSQKEVEFQLINNSASDLIGKSIVIDRSELELKYGKLPEQPYAVLVDEADHKFVAQLDDLDGDGAWDELFSQVDIKAGETKSFDIDFNDRELLAAIPVKTNIRFADINDASKEYTTAERLKSNTTEISQKYFQFEGPGWENDVVAFRNYFDARNGIDIFGKTTANMALDQCGLKGGPVYHELQPWGMDILKVANSLGAGAIALQTPSGLYRVGPDCHGTYTLVKEGSLRSIFDLGFEGIQIDGKTIQVKHQISIEAGKPYYNSRVWVDGDDEAKLVTGIVNLHSDSVYSKVNEDISYFYTYDNQAFDGEKLGLAIIVPTNVLTVQAAPEEGEGITQTFYTALPITEQPVEFYFMAGWEKQDAVYSTKAGFEKAIAKQAKEIAAQVDVRI